MYDHRRTSEMSQVTSNRSVVCPMVDVAGSKGKGWGTLKQSIPLPTP